MNTGLQILGSIALAAIPALIWGYIFYAKQKGKKVFSLMTFLVGAFSVFPILLYKFSWQFIPSINAFRVADFYKDDMIGISNVMMIPVSVVITFMIVGIIEEIMKMFSVKFIDDDEIKDIDDSIEFFIIAALGFSFMENILYFYNIWIANGASNLFIPFMFRSSFSTFAHIMFSGVFGYYYGIAHFAKPILQKELKGKRWHWINVLHRVFGFSREKMFHEEKLLEGAFIAITLHALFNVMLEMNWTFLIFPFLAAGYMVLSHMFNDKENQKKYGKVMRHVRNHPHPVSKMHFKRKALNSKMV